MPGVVEPLRDGFPTTITLTGAGTTFWEDETQPPGIDGGDPINITNMRNTVVHTKAPQHLYDVTPVQINAAYDPTAFDTVMEQININQEIVTNMPDGATVTWWGYLKSFIPGPHRKGEQPKAAITLIPTNINSSGVETPPVVVAGSGTGA